MAIQSYSLRKLEFQDAIDAAYELGFEYVELWPGHLPLDLDEGEFRRRVRAMRQNVLRRIAYGVVELTADHEKNRRVFELAKRLNLYALTASPAPDSFESVEKLVEEHRIAVAIHNHGPEDARYGKPELIEKAIARRHKLIGLCIDTGHFLRAGAKPDDVAKQFKDRVFAVHLKDVRSEGGKSKDVLLGQGDLDLAEFLRALKDSGFKGGLALEYEDEPDDPVPSIKKCLQAVAEAVKKL
ncbi:MAG: sugar phosphate isomerase/epimerase [Planctomycetes bacterium]|nr:sugar phosphate isomerase/epimerase [Planctomycetota bacterium]